jgi:High potential iron-sulfur protein
MQSRYSRRAVVKAAFVASFFIPLVDQPAIGAGTVLPPLDPNDPTAKALGFVTDSSKVDSGANPTHQPTQKCGTCAQFQGKPGDARGGCNIFSGHSVPQGGWCKVWAQKPGA